MLKDVSTPYAPALSGVPPLPLNGSSRCLQVNAWYNGVPHVFLVTLCDVPPGDEFLLDYGEQHRTQMAEAYTRCKSILVRDI